MNIPLLMTLPALFSSGSPDPAHAVEVVLDTWHLAAARADENLYFSLMTPEAVFLGTDATERWTREAFRIWAHPYFAKGKAWSFRAVKRRVILSKDQQVAWFDEELDTPNMGPARGTGVLVREEGGWKIAHYNLTVPIPNPLMKQVTDLIEKQGRGPTTAPAPGK